jgi:hypothetical protein
MPLHPAQLFYVDESLTSASSTFDRDGIERRLTELRATRVMQCGYERTPQLTATSAIIFIHTFRYMRHHCLIPDKKLYFD